jgi:simple sugar transport system ATP-binding protein
MFSSNKIILEAKNISKYFGTITALENVNLSVREGECLGVVGDNGAGKTTLMKVLSGLYKPSKGELYFNGNKEVLESPKRLSELRLRNGLSRFSFGWESTDWRKYFSRA